MKIMTCMIYILLFVVNISFARETQNLTPLYLKEYQGELVLNNNLFVGSEQTDFSEESNNELVFTYDVQDQLVLKGNIYFDLRIKTKKSDLMVTSASAIERIDGSYELVTDCLRTEKIKNNKKIVRASFKSCELDMVLLKGEKLLILISVGDSDAAILHSPKAASKILLPTIF